MPGSICVSVLEACDLPETIAESEGVAIKVVVGTREYQTPPSKAVGGKTVPWNLDFEFPVLNLRDNLLVILLDENGEAISRSEINTPSIVEQGSFDTNLLLNGGGTIHLSLSFVLTEEERQRIDVMRAAALKRREEEALKLSASRQLASVQGEVESGSSEIHSTLAERPEKDSETAGVAKGSYATSSQEVDILQFSPVSQVTHEESLICVEPTGKLDDPEKNIYGSVEGPSEWLTNSSDCSCKDSEITSLGNGNQELTRIADSTDAVNSTQVATDQLSRRNFDFINSSTIKGTDSEDHKFDDLDKSDLPQSASEENKELVEDLLGAKLKPTSSSVKAKIKAFEKTRPEVATNQNHTLSPSSKIQKFSPHSTTSPRRKVEGEVQQVLKDNEPFVDLETRRIKNEPIEPTNQTDAAEPTKIVLVGSMDLLSDKSSQSVDTKDIQCNKLEYQAVEAEQPKYGEIKSSSIQKSKNINLVGLSKQVLSGAISGAVLIAAVALLWAASPKKRNSRLHQRSKQRKRK